MHKRIVILEMANNHMGDISYAKHMIGKFAEMINHNEHNKYFSFAIKFQFRDYETYIHPSHQKNSENKYVQRFLSTKLTILQFKELKEYAHELGFITICTAFDETSVDYINELKFDCIKIASCSFTDWPLLNKIVEYDIPIIASTATSTLDDIDKVMNFLTHRNKNVSLMHCIGEYPTEFKNAELNQIDLLKKRYGIENVGLSSHESPDEVLLVMLAIAKGANIFEKHISIKTSMYNPNKYSVTPEQLDLWLKSAEMAIVACGVKDERHESTDKEISDVKQFKRGVYLKHDVVAGNYITRDDVYYAYPAYEGQLLANDMSKYTTHIALFSIEKDAAVMTEQLNTYNNREAVWDKVQKVKKFINDSGIPYPNNAFLELSHHYGLDMFDEFGISMITVINREYCKKLIIVLPGQKHPEQYHIKKEETFVILHGSLQLILDDVIHILNVGDIITIKPLQRHFFSSENGCIIEEISSTHFKEDSFYIDETIALNKNRKTMVKYWR